MWAALPADVMKSRNRKLWIWIYSIAGYTCVWVIVCNLIILIEVNGVDFCPIFVVLKSEYSGKSFKTLADDVPIPCVAKSAIAVVFNM